ncbi:MAG: terminase large subunit domain-containing protein [Bryobacteraceae bacterium]
MKQELSWAEAADPKSFSRNRLGFEPDIVQERVLNRSVHRGILNCTRQWGKSTVTAVKALHRALVEPNSLVLVASPSQRQSAEFLTKTRHFARALGLKIRGDGANEISLLLPNGSRLVGLPGKEATVRGFSNPALLLIDEASRVPDSLFEALTPMLATGNGDLWLMSTPAGPRGFFWETWERGGSQWTRIAVPATECPRISQEFLEEERQRKGDRVFRQEYLCEFVQGEDALFNEEDVEACVRREIPVLWK